MKIKFAKKILFAFLLAILIAINGASEAIAKTKTYGYSSPNKDYMYNQAANWWNVGDGSPKNGSAINAFAAAMSVLYGKKITPASVAKIAYESNIWNLSDAAPENLLSDLTTNSAFGGTVHVKASGSSTAQRLKALTQSFTKTDGVVIARATGKNPFQVEETGGHYILILAYKTDGKCLVYDPAQSSASPKWGSAKTLFNQMKSNIMFWVISKGSSTTAESIDFFDNQNQSGPESDYPQPENDDDGSQNEPEGDNYDDDDGSQNEPEGDNYDDDDTPTEESCIINPNQPNCGTHGDETSGDDDSGGETAPEGQPSNQKKSTLLGDNAVKASWPIISQNGAYCYNEYGVYYKWNISGVDLHNRESCGTNIRQEYKDMLSAAGINHDSASERQKIENLFAAVFKSANIDDGVSNYLANKTLLQYLEKNLTDVSSSAVEYGDVIYSGDNYYIYIDDKGEDYGNVITSRINEEVPHIDNYHLTDDAKVEGNARVFRITNDSEEEQGQEGGDQGGEQTQQEEDQENPKATIIADLAREVAWPTDNGKCYDKRNADISVYSVVDCYHYLKGEYKVLLATFNLTKSENELESESVETASARFIEAVLRKAELEGYTKGYIEAEAEKQNGVWKKVNGELAAGDLIKLKNRNDLFIFIGSRGGSYGNMVGMNKDGGVNPYVHNINTSTEVETIYRLRANQTPGGGDEDEPEEPPVTPPDEEAEDTGDAIAIRAMSFSWPYTKYSTDNSELWGKCVKKYAGSKTKYSKYPKETTKKWKISTYPTSTSCNKTLPTAYAEYLNITGNSKRNKGKVSAISFVKNVYASLGIPIPYYNISDIRSKLASNSYWELVTDNATKTTEFLPGDLMVSKNTIGIYVGNYGETYGKVAQAYYGKWVGRVTPLYLNGTMVFRPKSTTTINEDGISCASSETPSGNDKIVFQALKMSWPYLTGDANTVGKCDATNGSKVKFPEIYKYTSSNSKLTAKKKSASTLAKERKKTTCNTTYTNDYLTTSQQYLSKYTTSSSFLYTVLRSAGVNWFEPTTDTSQLNLKDIFKNLKADSEHFTVVSKKVTSAKDLLPGDILINSETKKNKTYSDALIYVGKANGTDCAGRVYGSVIRATSSDAPHLQTIYYRINNSSSRSYFWAFRVKESAYEQATTPGLPDPEVVEEETTTDSNAKIAIRAVEFSWPFTKYSTGSDNSPLNGKCIQRSNSLVAYPNLKSSGTQNNGFGGYIKDEYYTNTNCHNGFAPLYLKWIADNKTWTITDMVDSSGKYSDTIKNNSAAWNALTKAKGTRISGKNDCIGFVRNVLKSLGMKDIPSSPKSAYKNLNSDWKLIGTKIETPTKNKEKDISHFNSPKVTGGSNPNETLKPGDIVVNDHHIFIFLGDYGGKWGNRADANSGTWWGGQIHSIYTYDGRVYNSGNNKVFRYVGRDL